MSELTKEEREKEFDKEFKRLCDELYKSLNKPPLPCSPHPIPPQFSEFSLACSCGDCKQYY